MRERPILFSAPMIRALLAGKKTQTRRIMKPQPEFLQFHQYRGVTIYDGESRMWCWKNLAVENIWDFPNNDDRKCLALRCPHGLPGDRLWVRESFQPLLTDGVEWRDSDYKTGEGYTVNYCATGGIQEFYDCANDEAFCDRITPSIFMPRWASRITLEISEVRIERLQEISEEDAISEGIEPLFDAETTRRMPECDLKPMPWQNYLWHGNVGRSITAKQSNAWPHQYSSYEDPRDSYSSLWESINGAGSWAANPFVFAISFKVL